MLVWHRVVPVGCVAAALVSALIAEAAQSASAAPTDDETVALSPFVITAEVDEGYAPNETLSGTWQRAQVRDVASAMTVVTAEFMRDIGATNFNDVLNFMPSTATGCRLSRRCGSCSRRSSPAPARCRRSCCNTIRSS